VVLIPIQNRTSKIDSARNLEGFGQLSLDSPDEEGEAPEPARTGVAEYATLVQPATQGQNVEQDQIQTTTQTRKGKGRQKKRWADKCMFAELLELVYDSFGTEQDVLPQDLATNWIAMSPVPKGKRCILVAAKYSNDLAQGALRCSLV
jgi:snurportin-1